jgi:heat shock protein HslJ
VLRPNFGFALIILVAACADPGLAAGVDPTAVPWELEAGTVDGSELILVDGHPITLNITEDSANGTAACNGYGTGVLMAEGQITFSEIISTAMACSPEEVMESEARYLDALSRVDSFAGDKDRLTLTGDDVEMSFIALPPVPVAELTGTVWVLESLIDGHSVSNVAGERATLELYTDGSMLGATGCRGLHGRYAVTGVEVAFPDMTAEGECPAHLFEQDSHVIAVLGDGFRAVVDGQTLTLTSDGELGLVYRADG